MCVCWAPINSMLDRIIMKRDGQLEPLDLDVTA
jgi:hypothetical protein